MLNRVTKVMEFSEKQENNTQISFFVQLIFISEAIDLLL